MNDINLRNEIRRAVNAVNAGESIDEAVDVVEEFVKKNYLSKDSFSNINSLSVKTAKELYEKLGLSLMGHNGIVNDLDFENGEQKWI